MPFTRLPEFGPCNKEAAPSAERLPGGGRRRTIRVAALILGLAAAGAAQAAPASVAIGGLILEFDDAAWKVTAWPDGALVRPVGCAEVFCDDRTGLLVSIAPADGPLPTVIPGSEDSFVAPLWDLLDRPLPWPGDGAVREINGFAIYASDRWSGCRAMSPSELTAILDHAGRRYTFTSGVIAGCRGVWSVGREAFVEILSGLRPRD